MIVVKDLMVSKSILFRTQKKGNFNKGHLFVMAGIKPINRDKSIVFWVKHNAVKPVLSDPRGPTQSGVITVDSDPN